jgi:DNA-directed RNA polymerase specialized sigma24 family protein
MGEVLDIGAHERWTRTEEGGMAGDPDLDQLYHSSYRRLFVQMYAICGDVAEAEDAVQDAFVAALRKQRELRRVANPEAWVRTAALNRLRNTWRHASVVSLYQPKVPGPQSPVEPSPEHVAIVTALARVGRHEREVVVLHYLADLAGAADFFEPGEGYGDVLVCDIARERCTLAAPGPDDGLRLVPHLVLPN